MPLRIAQLGLELRNWRQRPARAWSWDAQSNLNTCLVRGQSPRAVVNRALRDESLPDPSVPIPAREVMIAP
jgi:hypothetical protein